jgi:hypothetical protein
MYESLKTYYETFKDILDPKDYQDVEENGNEEQITVR